MTLKRRLACLYTSVVAALSCPLALHASPLIFGNQHHPVIGANPYALAAGDLNDDGHTDLVVLTHDGPQGSSPGFAEVFISDGECGYEPPVQYQVGAFPRDAQIVHLNADTIPDLVTADDISGGVSVLLGNGDGTFAPAAFYSTGAGAFGIAAADLDDDGDIDLAVSNSGNDTLSVLLNSGAGVFSQGITPIAIAEACTDIVAADLNGDMLPDLVVATYSGFRTYLNLGSGGGEWGGLALGVNLVSGGTAWSIAAAQLDGQPGIDVIYTSWLTDEIYVHPGDGAGGFLPPAIYPVGEAPQDLDIADVDEDGDLDFAAVSFGDYANGVIIGLNNGAGDFSQQHFGEGGQAMRACIFTDADGDLVPDVIITSTVAQPAVAVLLNRPGTGISMGQNVDIGTMGTDITAADFDLDGDDDFAYTSNLTNEIHVVISNGDRTFQPLQTFPTNGGIGPWRIGSADLENDGDPDIVAGSGAQTSGAVVLLSNGDGTFASAITYPSPSSYRNIDLADVDGDGFVDIIGGGGLAPNQFAAVLYNNGDGTFGDAVSYPISAQGDGVIAADFDNDMDVDIAIADLNAKVSVILNNNDGTFTSPINYATGVFVQDLDAADFNEDGFIDLVTNNALEDTVSVLLNDGSGGFAARTDFTTGGRCYSVAVADINGDGHIDILSPLYSSNFMTSIQMVCVLLGIGDGTFDAPLLYPGFAPLFLAVGDFDSDGAPDTVTQGDLFGADILWGLAPVAPTPCPGDLNGDLEINISDLNSVLGNFGAAGAPGIPGDANEDGAVNITDLNLVLGNFGVSCSP